MTNWVLVVDQTRDLGARDLPHLVVTAEDYVARPFMISGRHQKIINLSRSYGYQTVGYYCSLLAEARGHRVIPSVETVLDIKGRSHYAHALPELEEELNKRAEPDPANPAASLFLAFGQPDRAGFDGFGALLFDWFRAPLLAVTIEPGEWRRIKKIDFQPLNKLDAEKRAHFRSALEHYTERQWKGPKVRQAPRYSIAVLYDPKETLPPSSPASLKHFSRVAARQGVEVEPIRRKDLATLAEFDALFIRETTSIRNHTYRFAQRAMREGMPVIDDPVSMIRCTNKVYLWERLTHAGVPVPKTIVVQDPAEAEHVADALGFPLVVKIPDGSFSRGIKKVDDLLGLKVQLSEFFKDTDLVLAQEFLPTKYDWRVGVLDGNPLFVCQYTMAKHHWQIVHHREDGTAVEGGARTYALDQVPPEVLEAGVRAARLIGDGLYGVDLKETSHGVHVIEVNDNPNLEHGVEDQVAKSDLWERLTRWFVKRIDA